MSRGEIEARIKKIFIEALPELKRNFKLSIKRSKTRHWDSFAHMEIVSQIERSFDIELKLRDIIRAESPAQFAVLVAKEI